MEWCPGAPEKHRYGNRLMTSRGRSGGWRRADAKAQERAGQRDVVQDNMDQRENALGRKMHSAYGTVQFMHIACDPVEGYPKKCGPSPCFPPLRPR